MNKALFLLMLGGMLLPVAAQAQISTEYAEIQDEGLIFANVCELDESKDATDTTCACKSKGLCSIAQLLQVVVNLGYFIFSIAGTIAFAAFVYGGVMWVTSAGNSDRIKKGRDAMAGALIGLAIIFGSYVAITLLISILKTGEPSTGTLEETVGEDADDVIETK